MWFSNSERRDNIRLIGCLLFNTDEFTVETPLRDEMTIFRTRKMWRQIFKQQFMLEENRDFKLITLRIESENSLALHCGFHTSFGRYAFWRLVSMQATDLLESLLSPFSKKRISQKPSIIALDKPFNFEPTVVNTKNHKQTTCDKIWNKLIAKLRKQKS